MVILKSLILSRAFQPALLQGDRGAGNKAKKGGDNASFKRDRKIISTTVSFIDDWEEADDYEGYGHDREFPYPANKGFLGNSVASRGSPHPLLRAVKSKYEVEKWACNKGTREQGNKGTREQGKEGRGKLEIMDKYVRNWNEKTCK